MKKTREKHGYSLLSVNLRLFDGEGAGAATAAGGAGYGSGTAAGPEHTPQGVRTRAGRAGRNNAAIDGGAGGTRVLYGKQPQGTGAPDAGGNESAADGSGSNSAAKNAAKAANAAAASDAAGKTPADSAGEPVSRTPEERREEFRKLIEGEYREEFGEATRRIIDRRFREGKENAERAEKTRDLLNLLGQRYGVDAQDIGKLAKAVEDDERYWTDEAERQGLSVEQVKRVKQAERENAALREKLRQQENREALRQQDQLIRENLRRWDTEAKEKGLAEKYPGFDLRTELGSAQFISLLENGVPLETAYQALHMDGILQGARGAAAAEAERKVTENIRARGSRPMEAGAGQPGAFTVKSDVSKLTREDMKEIRRRVEAGEKISFS